MLDFFKVRITFEHLYFPVSVLKQNEGKLLSFVFQEKICFSYIQNLFLFLGLCGWKILEGTTPYKILINDKTYLIAANEVRVNLHILN